MHVIYQYYNSNTGIVSLAECTAALSTHAQSVSAPSPPERDLQALQVSPLAPWSARELVGSLVLALAGSLAALLLLGSTAGPLWLRAATYAWFSSPLVHLPALCFAALLLVASGHEGQRTARLLRCAALALGAGVVLAAGLHLVFIR